MNLSPEFIKHLLLWSKIGASVSTLAGLIYGGFNWLRQISETNKNVNLLMTNHLPHIGATLQGQDASLLELKSDIRDIDTKVGGVSQRVEGMTTSFQSLEGAFIQHLENASKKETKKKSRRV